MVTVKVAVWTMVPLVAVTVIVYVPLVVLLFAVIVN